MFFTLEYDVIYAEFKNLKLYNFVKSDQNDTKFCTRPFLHNILKSMSLGGGGEGGLKCCAILFYYNPSTQIASQQGHGFW